MKRIKGKPENELMSAIFGESGLGYYPYIVVEEDGQERRVELSEAIQEVSTTLSSKDKKVLELRFGLLDGKKRTLREVGQELLGVNSEQVRRLEAKSLRTLRHSNNLRLLRQFFIPSQKEVSSLYKEVNCLRNENLFLKDRIKRLGEIIKSCDVKEEDFGGVIREDLASAVKALEEDRKAFQALVFSFPNTRVWSALRRGEVTEFSKLKELMKSGKIREFRGIGVGSKKFLQEILQKTEKEASP